MSEPIDPRQQFGEHGEWDALAVGWALSALDPADEERFADHLPGCARCTATVRESLYTVADLAYALPDEAPPAALTSRLMAAVAAEPRGPSAPPPADPVAPEGVAGGTGADGGQWPLGQPHPGSPGYGADRFAQPSRPAEDTAEEPDGTGVDEPAVADPGEAGDRTEPPAGADVVPPASRRRLARRIGVGIAAAAVVALVAGLLVSNVRLRGDQDELRQLVAQRDATIQQLTANGPARVAALTADGQPSPTRKATLVVRGDQVEIIIETLGATTGDQTYWLWTLRCDTPQPTDLKPIHGFTVTQSEFSVRDIGSDPGAATAPCFAISSELGMATPKAPRQVVAVGQPG
jgi:hypothetical protein